MTDPELLAAAIQASGQTATAFCRDVLVRNPRTVFRWLAGTSPLPNVVRAKCHEILRETTTEEGSK